MSDAATVERMKTCSTCGKAKSLDAFWRLNSSRDGRSGRCIACRTERRAGKRQSEYAANSAWRKANRERMAEYARNYRQRHPETPQAWLAEWVKVNPEKHRAHLKVRYALESGRLVRPEKCERCQRQARIFGHHADYSRPLEVEWLCAICHRQEHDRNKEAA